MEIIKRVKETALPLFIKYGLNVVSAVVILVLGWAAAKWFSQRVEKYIEHSHKIDSTLAPIFATITKVVILIVTIMAVLDKFGVQTTSIVALLGTIGLAIGLALQGTLSNIASGMLLLVLRPFRVGDVVDINGKLGVVDEIGLFITEMHSFDNIYISFPNSKVWGDKIENYTRFGTRRVDMEFRIHYNDDMDKAISIIKEIIDGDERVLSEPEPLIAVGTLADSSVNIRVRPWTQTANVWPLRYDLTKRIKNKFDEENITIPFPQRDVHFFSENGSDDAPVNEDAK